jgi:hypothetical protein
MKVAVEQLLRDAREAEWRAKDFEQRARRARRDAVRAKLQAWRIQTADTPDRGNSLEEARPKKGGVGCST